MLGLGYDPARINTVEDARRIAKRRLPRMAFDYVDGAADGEVTMRANRAVFDEVAWLPRMAATQGQPDLSTTVLGQPVSMPLLLSPCGLTRMVHRTGDVAVAQAAGEAGTLFTLSCMSGHRLEDVAAAATGPRWFQLYFLGGRAGAEQLIDRAQRAGYQALAVTVDTQMGGNRERDARNGLRRPLAIDLRNTAEFLPQVAPKLRWLKDFARDGFRLDLPNASSLSRDGAPLTLDEAQAAMAATPPRWEDFAWIREQWQGPVLVKGILTVDDAKRAVDVGAAGVIVSNHGGRQLDTVAPTLRAMAAIVDAVGDRLEVYMDGGVRRGSDVAKVVALGGRAAMIGRPWVYALGAGGQAGVGRILEMFRFDLGRALRLMGCPSVAALDRSWVQLPATW
jgi:isopentenyl diphosphate isomerase/L-lactate dehydrogenase-like FMN-dependent dehydrogenase